VLPEASGGGRGGWPRGSRHFGSNTEITLILPLTTTRRILTYPGAMFEMGIEDLDLDYLATAKHFHLSSLFLHRKLSPHIPSYSGK